MRNSINAPTAPVMPYLASVEILNELEREDCIVRHSSPFLQLKQPHFLSIIVSKPSAGGAGLSGIVRDHRFRTWPVPCDAGAQIDLARPRSGFFGNGRSV